MAQQAVSYNAPGNYPITHFPLAGGSIIAPALGGSSPRTIMLAANVLPVVVNGRTANINFLQDDANTVVQKLRAAGIGAHLDSHGRLVLDIASGSSVSGDSSALQALGLA